MLSTHPIRRPTLGLAAFIALLLSLLRVGLLAEQPSGYPSGQEIVAYDVAGEFCLARRQAGRLAWEQHQAMLGRIVQAQVGTGDQYSASRDAAELADPRAIASGLAQARAGGAAMADFATLMQLIQNTIAPDIWDEMGGPSSMAPYANGIYVDPRGIVRDVDVTVRGRDRPHADDLDLLRGRSKLQTQNDDWRQASGMRCVSLRRLGHEYVRLRLLNQPVPAAMRNMAGLSRIEYVFFDDETSDVILAGLVGGVEFRDGWHRDLKTGATPLAFASWQGAAYAVFYQQPIGCTIDPTNEGISRALEVSRQNLQRPLPPKTAADTLATALGLQRVETIGMPGDHPLAWMLVEADRHMKQLALGQHAMPPGVPNYLDMIQRHIASGPPSEHLLRLWFTAQGVTVRTDPQRQLFRLDGHPLQLVGEDQRPSINGQRRVAEVDPRSRDFIKHFNQAFRQIADLYPLYHALEALYGAAGVAELMRRELEPERMQSLLAPFAQPGSGLAPRLPVPKSVDSIAVSHRVRAGKRQHQVTIASGGVSVDPRGVVSSEIEIYPSLTTTQRPQDTAPAAVNRWWWNGEE